MKKIYFVRHGESEANVQRIVAGSETEAALTDNGRDQARKAGYELIDKHIDLIVASPMSRTKETAEIIADVIGYDLAKIVESKLFIELRAGPYAGKSYEFRKKHIQDGKMLPGIESANELHERVLKGFKWLKNQPHNNIVLVSHGGTSRMVQAIIEDLPKHDFLKIEKTGEFRNLRV